MYPRSYLRVCPLPRHLVSQQHCLYCGRRRRLLSHLVEEIGVRESRVPNPDWAIHKVTKPRFSNKAGSRFLCHGLSGRSEGNIQVLPARPHCLASPESSRSCQWSKNLLYKSQRGLESWHRECQHGVQVLRKHKWGRLLFSHFTIPARYQNMTSKELKTRFLQSIKWIHVNVLLISENTKGTSSREILVK